MEEDLIMNFSMEQRGEIHGQLEVVLLNSQDDFGDVDNLIREIQSSYRWTRLDIFAERYRRKVGKANEEKYPISGGVIITEADISKAMSLLVQVFG